MIFYHPLCVGNALCRARIGHRSNFSLVVWDLFISFLFMFERHDINRVITHKDKSSFKIKILHATRLWEFWCFLFIMFGISSMDIGRCLFLLSAPLLSSPVHPPTCLSTSFPSSSFTLHFPPFPVFSSAPPHAHTPLPLPFISTPPSLFFPAVPCGVAITSAAVD